jgi:hypothetical protein
VILFEKYNITNGKNELLNGWTETFDNIDEYEKIEIAHIDTISAFAKINEIIDILNKE